MENFVNWFEREYDYLNEEVPFMELETPRNKEELELLHKRVIKEFGKAFLRLAYQDTEYVRINESASKLENFGIYRVEYPYMNIVKRGKESKKRPSLVLTIDMIDSDPVCMMITSKIKKLDKYDALLKDWKESGLDTESAVKADSVRRTDKLNALKFYGFISGRDYLMVMKKFNKFMDEAFDTPWNFLNWLIMYRVKDTTHPSGNNNYNKVQDLYEIAKSRMANWIDIAINTHRICDKCKFENKIIYIACESTSKTGGVNRRGHFIPAFKVKGSYYAMLYSQLDFRGEVIKYENADSFEFVASEVFDIFEDGLSNGMGRDYETIIHILSDKDMKLIDDRAYLKTHNQKELCGEIYNSIGR